MIIKEKYDILIFMKNTTKILALILAGTGLFSGCRKNSNQNAKITVTAATFPCYDAVRAVSGNFLKDGTISLKLLCKPGIEVHSFDPSPQDIISINTSNLFVYIGGESDEWVEKIIKSEKNSSSNFLKLLDYAELFDEPESLEEHSKETSHSHDEKSENPHEKDEHIWTSPKNEIQIVKTVCKTLQNIAEQKNLPELSENLKQNAENYIQQIENVIQVTQKVLSDTPEKFIVMADRFPFVYFTEFYGINYAAAFSGCSTAVEASTGTIAKIIDIVNKKHLPAVFYIELGNHKIATSIAESCGIKALELQSCQNVTKTDFENGETWVSLMLRNAENLKNGLRQWL